MDETKKCKSCYSDINSKAKICQFCRSSQNFIGIDPKKEWLGIAFFIIGIFFIAYTKLNNKNRHMVVHDYTDLSIKAYSINYYQIGLGSGIACIFEISNPTDSEFYDFYYKVEYFSENGEIVDSITYFDDLTYVQKKSNVKSKTYSFDTDINIKKYKCEIKILSARVKK